MKFIRLEYRNSFEFINLEYIIRMTFEKPHQLIIELSRNQHYIATYTLPDNVDIESINNQFTEFLTDKSLNIFAITIKITQRLRFI